MINDFPKVFLLKLTFRLFFKAMMGLKEDNTKEGYNPAKIPVSNAPKIIKGRYAMMASSSGIILD